MLQKQINYHKKAHYFEDYFIDYRNYASVFIRLIIFKIFSHVVADYFFCDSICMRLSNKIV